VEENAWKCKSLLRGLTAGNPSIVTSSSIAYLTVLRCASALFSRRQYAVGPISISLGNMNHLWLVARLHLMSDRLKSYQTRAPHDCEQRSIFPRQGSNMTVTSYMAHRFRRQSITPLALAILLAQ
jgi:hypothetical protein